MKRNTFYSYLALSLFCLFNVFIFSPLFVLFVLFVLFFSVDVLFFFCVECEERQVSEDVRGLYHQLLGATVREIPVQNCSRQMQGCVVCVCVFLHFYFFNQFWLTAWDHLSLSSLISFQILATRSLRVVLRKVGCQKQCWGRCVKKHATAVAPPVKAAIIFRMILMVGTGALCVGTSTTIRSPFSFTSSNSMCAHVHYIIRTCFNSVDIQRL